MTNVKKKMNKDIFGNWAGHPILKEAEAVNKEQLMQGMEGVSTAQDIQRTPKMDLQTAGIVHLVIAYKIRLSYTLDGG